MSLDGSLGVAAFHSTAASSVQHLLIKNNLHYLDSYIADMRQIQDPAFHHPRSLRHRAAAACPDHWKSWCETFALASTATVNDSDMRLMHSCDELQLHRMYSHSPCGIRWVRGWRLGHGPGFLLWLCQPPCLARLEACGFILAGEVAGSGRDMLALAVVMALLPVAAMVVVAVAVVVLTVAVGLAVGMAAVAVSQ